MARETDGRIRFRPVGARAQRRESPEYGPASTGCPAVERAVEGLYQAQSEESFWTLMSALNYAMEIDTEVLLPVQLAPGVHGTPAPWAEHPIPADRAGDVRFWTLHSDKGRNWLPLFTSSAAAAADRSTADRPMVQKKLQEAMELALEDDGVDGVVINPWGRSATLERPLLNGLLKAEVSEAQPGEAELEAGREASQRGDWAAAARSFQDAAEKGSAAGLRLLARCLYRGRGVRRSRTEALRMWEQASEMGDVLSTVLLGDACAEGTGGPARALLSYRRAWEQAARQPDIEYSPLVCLRMAQYEARYTSPREALALAAEARQGFRVRLRENDPEARQGLEEAEALLRELTGRPEPKAAYHTETSQKD